ncbi:phosphopantetheine-binding protein [Saccharothrix lopnurensis]|uniref:Phosphopantetheine-binding protein n=1 Tax=Saccharothrix lopnurensis TaxID=1670621 RepID=A0ABW1PGR3_9PSEU
MEPAVQIFAEDIDATIRRFVRVPFTDASTLAEIGLDSLTTLRVVAELVPDPDREIDLAELADLKTLGRFRAWVAGQVAR